MAARPCASIPAPSSQESGCTCYNHCVWRSCATLLHPAAHLGEPFCLCLSSSRRLVLCRAPAARTAASHSSRNGDQPGRPASCASLRGHRPLQLLTHHASVAPRPDTAPHSSFVRVASLHSSGPQQPCRALPLGRFHPSSPRTFAPKRTTGTDCCLSPHRRQLQYRSNALCSHFASVPSVSARCAWRTQRKMAASFPFHDPSIILKKHVSQPSANPTAHRSPPRAQADVNESSHM